MDVKLTVPHDICDGYNLADAQLISLQIFYCVREAEKANAKFIYMYTVVCDGVASNYCILLKLC